MPSALPQTHLQRPVGASQLPLLPWGCGVCRAPTTFRHPIGPGRSVTSAELPTSEEGSSVEASACLLWLPALFRGAQLGVLREGAEAEVRKRE